MDLRPQSTAPLDAGTAASDLAVTVFNCPAVPTAYFMDFADPWTGMLGTQKALIEAGFDVQPLPLDRSPALLKGAIVFGSFASAAPEYTAYMGKYAADPYGFVDRGNVLLQMTQADQSEVVPPFLPSTQVARRGDHDLDKLLCPEPPVAASGRRAIDKDVDTSSERHTMGRPG